MDKERIRKVTQNPDNIPGVYNYCDRWCERCIFTTRCANFAIGSEMKIDKEDLDSANELFWKEMNEIFRITIEIINEEANKRGIDLDAIEFDKKEIQTRKSIEIAVENHESIQLSKIYMKKTKMWFDESENILRDKEKDINAIARLDLPGIDPVNKVATINDSIEVIQWYNNFIYVKLFRALMGKIKDEHDDLAELPKDSDGSAKIALIAIDRSLSAWAIMLENFSAQEGPILKILMILEKLRRLTETTFPAARSFVRPGFDE